MRRNVERFIRENKTLTCCLILALIEIFIYFATWDEPELFNNAGIVLEIINSIAIGFVVNFIFYVTQVYIPSLKRNKIIYACISDRINDISTRMKELLKNISKEDKQELYNDIFFDDLLNIRLSEETRIGDSSKCDRNQIVFFTVRDLLLNNICDVGYRIDTLIAYYKEYLQPDVMADLEAIKKSMLHTTIRTVLFVPNDVNFSTMKNNNFYKQYYFLAMKLILDSEKFYRLEN